MITAAIVDSADSDFQMSQIELDEPRDDEVRVRIMAAGMCHTDLAVRAGHTPFPLPAVLGHEGAGVVEAVGRAVSDVQVGDRVVLSYASCGRCPACYDGRPVQCATWMPLNFGGGRLDGSNAMHWRQDDPSALHGHFFGQSSFATATVVSGRSVIRVESDAAWEVLAPLGCAVQTGAGTVLNVLRPHPGSSLVVYGAGSVGLAAVLAAQLTPVSRIVVVDLVPERLELARSLGATHAVDARGRDVLEAVRDVTSGGANLAIDTTGNTSVLRQAVDGLAVNGICAVVGAPPFGSEVAFDANNFLIRNPVVVGINQGLSAARTFIPALIALHDNGRLPVDKLVTTFPFTDINAAAKATLDGTAIKPVLLMA
jgi:aryl-alcohol dehydrogenase